MSFRTMTPDFAHAFVSLIAATRVFTTAFWLYEAALKMDPYASSCWPPPPHTSAPLAAIPKPPPACPKTEEATEAYVEYAPSTGLEVGHPARPRRLAFSEVRNAGRTPASHITACAPAGQFG